MTARQLPLALPHRPALGREDFLVADCNQAAVAWLDLWPDWPGPGLAIHGPAGCGKTHLAEVWRARSGASRFVFRDLADAALGEVAIANAVVVEDIDGFAGDAAGERALLHLYNRCTERGASLLLTLETPPIKLGIVLADLRSRILALPAIAVGAPDEALVEAVLVKQFADRQLRVPPDVITYIVPRLERSFAAASRLVDALDRAALSERRNITIALAREVMRVERD
ncbi:MAG TPA: DnaA/Hda family protein [Alphaproteobacteria bacterium]|nr:DnaA/Hda family protein [Alphaproteobacteria bacterium]